jgi:hypothetical protein
MLQLAMTSEQPASSALAILDVRCMVIPPRVVADTAQSVRLAGCGISTHAAGGFVRAVARGADLGGRVAGHCGLGAGPGDRDACCRRGRATG